MDYEEVDEGVDWSGWYYLLVLSLPRRKVIYQIQRYYKTALYCDGTEGERQLVKEERYVYDEYNQASLFGVEDYLEWNTITLGVEIKIGNERKIRDYVEGSPMPNSPDSQDVRPVSTPLTIEPQPVTVGKELFADVQVVRKDDEYAHLFTKDEVLVNGIKGKFLYRDELPAEFFAQNGGVNAKLFQVIDVTVRRVTDDPSSDRRVVRYTIREIRDIFK